MKKFIWAIATIAVIAGLLTLTAPLVVAQDLDGPVLSSTQGRVEEVERDELVEEMPNLIQNWIYMVVGFVIMVGPYIWYYYRWGPGKDKRK